MITPKLKLLKVPHRSRPRVRSEPLHVTVHLVGGLPDLRNPLANACICRAIRAAQERFGCRVVTVSVLSNHLHLIVEAQDEEKLSQAMKGLLVRIARALNKLWQRTGPIFLERFHCVVLKTVKQIRNAVRYVLQNARNHGIRLARNSPDPYSSGPWYRFWRERMNQPFCIDDCPVAEARTPHFIRACTVVPIGLNELPAWSDDDDGPVGARQTTKPITQGSHPGQRPYPQGQPRPGGGRLGPARVGRQLPARRWTCGFAAVAAPVIRKRSRWQGRSLRTLPTAAAAKPRGHRRARGLLFPPTHAQRGPLNARSNVARRLPARARCAPAPSDPGRVPPGYWP